MNELSDKFREEFKDKETRRIYVDDFLNAQIATQIKVLREQRGLKQSELAELTGMRQERISVLEDVDYSAWTISTLKRLAEAFDLRLSVKFESFGSYLYEFENFNREALEKPSFDEDPEFTGVPQINVTTMHFDKNVIANVSVADVIKYIKSWRTLAHVGTSTEQVSTGPYFALKIMEDIGGIDSEDTDIPEIPIPRMPMLDYSSHVIA